MAFHELTPQGRLREHQEVNALPDKDGASAKTCNGDQPPPTPVGPEHETPDAQAVTSKGERRRNVSKDELDRSMVNWTRAVAVFTAFLALLAGLQAWIIWGQWGEMKAAREGGDKSFADQIAVMQGQLNQMNLAQRPWVKLESSQPDSLTSDDAYGVSFWAKVVVSNVGHSPAQNVSVTADLLIRDFDPSINEGMKAACQKGDTDSWIIPGQPIFPGQTQTINGDGLTSWIIDIHRIRNARLGRINNTFNNKAATGDTMRAAAWANEIAKFPFFAPIALVGCINYRSPDNRILYQTRVCRQLSQIKAAAR